MNLVHLVFLVQAVGGSILALAADSGSSGSGTGDLANAGQDANENMLDEAPGGSTQQCPNKCPHCGRKKHDSGKYPRRKSERRKALLNSLSDPAIPESAKKTIRDSKGNNVPSGYEVSHDPPLYTEKDKGQRCKLDVAANMKLMTRKDHRAMHAPGGVQDVLYPPSAYK